LGLRETMGFVLTLLKSFRCVCFAVTLAALGCHAQTAPKTVGSPAIKAASDVPGTLSPDMERRVAVLIRSHSDVPPEYAIHVGPRTKSDLPGYDAVKVEFTAPGQSIQPITFLLSTDGKTLAQFRKYDISKDPKALVSGADRPSRGGAADAPVLIVVFDDLECPFCAKMNAQMMPAVLARYKDQVHVVYKDWPEDQHPWAMRAAIDTNCVAAQSAGGYWALVDYIHAHASEFGGAEHSLAKANEMLDSLTRAEAKEQKIDVAKVDACVAKQDATAIKKSVKEGEALGINSTPTIYINGEKIEGAVPVEYVERAIDGALTAEGVAPPAAPAMAAPVKAAVPAVGTAAKPGN
jgi:protein-disulfide isomerase